MGKFKIHSWTLLIILFIIVGINLSCEDEAQEYENSSAIQTQISVKQLNIISHWQGEGKRERIIKDFCREYEFENQQLLINMKYPNDIYSVKNADFITNLIRNHSKDWDIVLITDSYNEINNNLNNPNWAKENLVDFSKIPEFVRNTRQELMTESLKKKWGGIVPGPIIEGQYWALWSNKNVADKVGIDIKQFGMTFDDFMHYIKLVNDYNNSNSGTKLIPLFDHSDWQTSFVLAFQLYTSLLSNIKDETYIISNDEKLQLWYQTLKALETLAQYNVFGEGKQFSTWSQSNQTLVEEECLFYINGSWMYNIWEEYDRERLKNCIPNEMPVLKPVNIFPGTYIAPWGVLKSAKNKKEAVNFLLALNSSDIAEQWVKDTKCPTGIKGSLTDVFFDADHFENFTHHIQTTYKGNGYSFEELARFLPGANQTGLYFMEVMSGEMNAEEALEALKNDITLLPSNDAI